MSAVESTTITPAHNQPATESMVNRIARQPKIRLQPGQVPIGQCRDFGVARRALSLVCLCTSARGSGPGTSAAEAAVRAFVLMSPLKG
jgi:hypothetical protein